MQNPTINDMEADLDDEAAIGSMDAEAIDDSVPRVDSKARYNELRKRAEDILEQRRLKRELDYLDDDYFDS